MGQAFLFFWLQTKLRGYPREETPEEFLVEMARARFGGPPSR